MCSCGIELVEQSLRSIVRSIQTPASNFDDSIFSVLGLYRQKRAAKAALFLWPVLYLLRNTGDTLLPEQTLISAPKEATDKPPTQKH